MGAHVILAGDIGGTKALLMLAAVRDGRPAPLLERRYLAADFVDFSAMLTRFVDECRAHRGRTSRLSRYSAHNPTPPRRRRSR